MKIVAILTLFLLLAFLLFGEAGRSWKIRKRRVKKPSKTGADDKENSVSERRKSDDIFDEDENEDGKRHKRSEY